jgi:hypothetical protein
MKVVVAHHSTEQAVKAVVDQGVDQLLAGAGGKSVQIVDQKKSWDGPVMTFSCTGKVGFISVPLAATVTVDDTNVTVDCDLPPMVKNFVGEEKVSGIVEENVRKMIGAVAA